MRTAPIPNNDHILTAQGAGEYLRLSTVTIYRLTKNGQIPYRRVGGQYRFTTTALDAWLMGNTLSPEATDAILHAMPVAVER
jgi:excisionase family DNA binding protein